MLDRLSLSGERFFGAEFSAHLRSGSGEYRRVEHALDNLHFSLSELRETNNSLLSTKQNEIMKTLTVLAFIVLPLTLISQIFGMNTSYLPVVGFPGDFWIVMGIMVCIGGAFFVYFKRRGWL